MAAAAGLMAAVVSAACTSTTDSSVHHICGDVGYARSRVIVAFDDVALPTGPETLRVCVRRVCTEVGISGPRRLPYGVGVDRAEQSPRYPITVTIIRRHETLFSGHVTAATTQTRPNGPGCGPVVYEARVTAHGTRSLTA